MTIEVRLKHKDGHYLWVETNGKLFIDEVKGNKIIVISRDISKRKTAEQKLKESEEKYRQLFENSPNMIVLLDSIGKIIDINKIALNFMNFNKNDLIGKNFRDLQFIPVNQLIVLEEKYRELFTQGSFSPIELQGYDKDKRVVWIKLHAILIKLESKTLIQLIIEDITEQNKIEYQLKESEEKYRMITEQLLIGVAIIQDNVFQYVSQRYAEIGGFSVEEMINWQPGEFINTVYPKDREIVMEQSIKKQHGDEDVITQYTFRALTKTSEIIWVELYSKTITYEGRPAVLITLIDITSSKQAELKLKKSEEKYREAYEIASLYKDLLAHDIKNILNNISMSSKLSTMALKNPANLSIIEEYLNIINEQVNKGADLISNVRKLSEIDDSKIPIEPTKLQNHLNESISSIKKVYHDRNINIHLKLYDRKVIVKANSLLEEIFVNILNNAVNYNENSSVEILVKTSKEQKYKQNYIKIEFMDNGIGISDPQKESIFKKRCREHKGGKGMGFGLTLVKKIVDSYKGEIWVEDKVKGDHSKGSNFVLLIPLVK